MKQDAAWQIAHERRPSQALTTGLEHDTVVCVLLGHREECPVVLWVGNITAHVRYNQQLNLIERSASGIETNVHTWNVDCWVGAMVDASLKDKYHDVRILSQTQQTPVSTEIRMP